MHSYRSEKNSERNQRGKMSSDIANSTFIKTCTILDDQAAVIHFSPTSRYKIVHIIMSVICAMLTLTTIYLNACTVITIWRTKTLKAKMSNFTIMIQSSMDLLQGTLVMPLFTFCMASETAGSASCVMVFLSKKIAALMYLFSLTTFSMMNHERYMGVCYPIIHRSKMQKSKLMKYVIAVCGLQMLLLGSTLLYNRIMRILLGLICVAFFVHTIFVYSKIARTVQMKVRTIRDKRNPEERSRLKQYLGEVKAAKTCFLVIFCSIVCGLPVLLASSGAFDFKSLFTEVILKRYFNVLVMLNSSLNSVILFWRNKKLRIHAKTLLKWNCR